MLSQKLRGTGKRKQVLVQLGQVEQERDAWNEGQWTCCKIMWCEGCGAPHLGNSSNATTEGKCPEEDWRQEQAGQGLVGALPVVVVDEAKAVCDPNAHVEAVGQDEAHAATPMGQEIG